MLFDKQSMFSDQQAITASAASTNIIDLGAPETPKHAAAAITQDIGKGRPIPLWVQVTEDFDALTSLQITLQMDTVEAFSSPTTVITTPAILLASLVAGYKTRIDWVPEGVVERFIRLNYAVNGTNPTVGKITAGFVFGRSNWAA